MTTEFMTSERSALMTHFLQLFFKDTPYQLERLAGDASFRCYYRISTDGESYLLMDAPPTHESVAQFVVVARLLENVVNVPDMMACDVDHGFLLLQDFGDVQFAQCLTPKDNPKDSSCHNTKNTAPNQLRPTQGYRNQALYQMAWNTLAQIQTIAPSRTHLSCYHDNRLDEEMMLFWHWFLPYVGVAPSEQAVQLWTELKETIIQSVLAMPKVVVHRDYHSRNLMIDKHSDRLGVIDFQDALIGSYSYDVVSLVRDAYIDSDEPWVAMCLADAYAILQIEQRFGRNFGQFVQDVNIMGVQRLLKVLGIFVRLYRRDGKARYLADIPKVMRDLLAVLDMLAHDGTMSVVGDFRAWLDEIVIPSYQQVGGD